MRISVFDFDDTLCDFSGAFHDWMSRRLGGKFEPHSCYNLLEPYHAALDEDDRCYWTWLRRFETSRKHMSAQQIEEGVNLLWRAMQDTNPLIVTARKWMENPVDDTLEWLHRNGFHINRHNILIVDPEESKAAAVKKFIRDHYPWAEVVMAVDDLSKHLEDYRKSFPNATLVMPRRPWNEADQKLYQTYGC